MSPPVTRETGVRFPDGEAADFFSFIIPLHFFFVSLLNKSNSTFMEIPYSSWKDKLDSRMTTGPAVVYQLLSPGNSLAP